MTLLIGVAHEKENLEAVINRLDHEKMGGKKVMVEMFSYPTNIDASIIAIDSSFGKFWNGIGKYVLDNNGSLVFGESESLYYTAIEEMKRICRLIKERRAPMDKKYDMLPKYPGMDAPEYDALLEWQKESDEFEKTLEPLQRQYDMAPHILRNPHFAKMIVEQKPDIVLLGADHIPYLIKHCFRDYNYSVCFIPHEVNPYGKPNLVE
jgi:hypothetical protein